LRSLAPDVLHSARSQNSADCVIVSMATIFNLTYSEALLVCSSIEPHVLTRGLCTADTVRALEVSGIDFVRRAPGTFDVETSTGMLDVGPVNKRFADHTVALWAGRIVEYDGQLWLHAADYLHNYMQRPHGLIEVPS
jgi:hypothetical protein